MKRFWKKFAHSNSHHLFNSLTGYPAGYLLSGQPDICYPASRISVIRPAGYPANGTGYPAGYRISKKAGYPASRISGTTLDIDKLCICESLNICVISKAEQVCVDFFPLTRKFFLLSNSYMGVLVITVRVNNFNMPISSCLNYY